MGLTHPRRLSVACVIGALALISAGCSSSITNATSTSVSTLDPASSNSITLLTGRATVEAARSFDDPGFHHSLSIQGILPTDLDGAEVGVSGYTILISLRDASRPEQTCDRDHPLSGCVTIDWADSPGRPHVPTTGVFDNQVSLMTTRGLRHLYLSEAGSLSEVSNDFSPG